MSFRERRVLLMTPFYMLFEFFLLKYLFALIGGVSDISILALTVVIGIMNFLPMLFEKNKSTFMGRLITEISAVWMWASLMYLIEIIIIYAAGTVIAIPEYVIYIALLIVPAIGVYGYWNAHRIVVKDHVVNVDNLTSDINLIHISDIHFGSVRYKKIIKQLADTLKKLSDTCDIVIISGDLADGSCLVCEDDFMHLKDVGMPIIFTPGNHDFYPGIENVKKACRKAGIIVLDNQSFDFKDLNIYGLTYSFGDIPTPSDEELKKEVKKDKCNVIVYHVPERWDDFSRMGFDIQLSGHTHGGQFYPVVNIGDVVFDFNRGLFNTSSGKYISVTTGVGTMDQPIRWGTNSEVVILKLRK